MNSDELHTELEATIRDRVPTLDDSPGYDDLPHTLRPTLHAHLDWLGSFGSEFVKRWLRLVRNELEAAATEAAVRELLGAIGHIEDLRPGADPPDLECSIHNRSLAVECTSLLMDTATRRTHLKPAPSGFARYSPINRAIANKIQAKAHIAPAVPLLLVVGTFHFTASGAPLSERHLRELIDGPDSAFRHRGRNGASRPARQTVSAVLVLGFSAIKTDGNCVGLGVLNPDAHHSFDPQWLPQYEFLRANE